MLFRQVPDWDDAYANTPHIVDGERLPEQWSSAAAAFREARRDLASDRMDVAYGDDARQRLDLFVPATMPPRGLLVFVHGGYWRAFDKSSWSHYAAGPLGRGWAVALPSYRLCPTVRIADIVADCAAAIAHAAGLQDGPLVLSGHSAGGHLVSRMIAEPSPLPEPVRRRVRRVVSISGLHDLRPLMPTALNATLRIDAAEAAAHSPALLTPCPGTEIVAWVGGGERAEFRRQSELLANVWTGLAARTAVHEAPDRHHFSVIDELTDSDSPLTRTVCAIA